MGASDNRIKFKDKKVLVVGLGKSGLAAAGELFKLGARLTLQDSKTPDSFSPEVKRMFSDWSAMLHLGEAIPAEENFDLIVLSPGVPPNGPLVAAERQKILRSQSASGEGSSEIIGELELAYRIGRGNYAAITGTNGKTTTTTLVGELFKAGGRPTHVVGNIGTPVVSVSLSAGTEDWLVTEVSSFQLETVESFRPKLSAILNLTPDHLDRHGSMENYGAVKAKIFQNQGDGDYCILNYDDPLVKAMAPGSGAKVVPFSRKEILDFGAFVVDNQIVIKIEKGDTIPLCSVGDLQIPGAHNLENALAAVALAYFGGVPAPTITKVLKSFQGVPHRLEFCREIEGVRFVNDSKGTNTDASIKAIEAIEGGIVLIAGGYDKGADFGDWIEAFGEKVKGLVLLGKTAPQILKTAREKGSPLGIICADMEACVRKAYELAGPGDTVLLSPACASWDMYNCFEERGEDFKDCVNKLWTEYQQDK